MRKELMDKLELLFQRVYSKLGLPFKQVTSADEVLETWNNLDPNF